MKSNFNLCLLIMCCFSIKNCFGIWCYRCTSATPGCAETFNWRGIGYLGDSCPEKDDICVKVVEKKEASVTIIRDCMSSLRAFRTDMPADHYEGCRKAAKDVRLGHYVFNNTIKELDIRRDYFDYVEWCFCFLDHRCNGATSQSISRVFLSLAIIVATIFGTLSRW